MLAYDHTLVYAASVRGTLGICRVRSSYASIRRCTMLYAEAKIFFEHVQQISAYVSV